MARVVSSRGLRLLSSKGLNGRGGSRTIRSTATTNINSLLQLPSYVTNDKNCNKRISISMKSITEAAAAEEQEVIVSNISLLEHININIPNHDHIKFYSEILRLQLDPRRAENLEKGEGTIWFNAGASQFHLPFGEVPQVIPGVIGLRFSALDSLVTRLLNQDTYKYHIFDSNNYVRVYDAYGNVFDCRANNNNNMMIERAVDVFKQPVVEVVVENNKNTDTHANNTECCLGIDYVELKCPRNTAIYIAEFYKCVFGAEANVIALPSDTDDHDEDNNNDKFIAIIGCGEVLENRAAQNIIYREVDDDDEDLAREYDGHHIALYVGHSQEEFEEVFKNCEQAGVVWVNPRFSDKAKTLEGAKRWQQFRMKDILKLENGKKVFTLEHEVRCVNHNAWPGRSFV